MFHRLNSHGFLRRVSLLAIGILSATQAFAATPDLTHTARLASTQIEALALIPSQEKKLSTFSHARRSQSAATKDILLKNPV